MKVSIIVPVYKSEPFLEDCINSIINQIFTDWELILVDDGSPDFCGRICDSFAVKDSRIKVLHQKIQVSLLLEIEGYIKRRENIFVSLIQTI